MASRGGRPRKDAPGWHALPVPHASPRPSLPDYSINALSQMHFAASSDVSRSASHAFAPPHVNANWHQQEIARAMTAPSQEPFRRLPTPPAVPPKRDRSSFTSNDAHEAHKQERRKAQKRIQELGRAPRDRSGRSFPAAERAAAERKRAKAKQADDVKAAHQQAAVALVVANRSSMLSTTHMSVPGVRSMLCQDTCNIV